MRTSTRFWRHAVRTYVRRFPTSKGEQLVMETMAPLYADEHEEICVWSHGPGVIHSAILRAPRECWRGRENVFAARTLRSVQEARETR